jgi:hypothetical protein
MRPLLLASLILLVPLAAPATTPQSYDADAAITLALATFSPSTPVCDCGCADGKPCTCGLKCPDVLMVKMPSASVDWQTPDFDAAAKLAAESGRSIFVEVTGPGCIPCRQMESIFADPAIAGILNARFVSVKIDASKNPEFAAALSVTRVPAHLVYAPNRVLAWSDTGYRDARTFAAELTAAADERPVNVFATDPSDVSLRSRVQAAFSCPSGGCASGMCGSGGCASCSRSGTNAGCSSCGSGRGLFRRR